jgi:PKD repeat protein
MNKYVFTLLLILGFFPAAKADHITGGEMYYTFLGESGGKYRYRMTVKLFKDCLSNRQLVSPTIVSVFDRSTTNRVEDISVLLSRTEIISLTNPNKCITNPPAVCYEVGYYEFELSLPASENGYIVTCQIVFRIAGISNLISNYGSIGATYTSEIPATPAASNSSARFTGDDMVVVCANNSFSYSFAASDYDGDELRYSFCNAYQGGFFGGANSPPPAGPPYQSVPYGPGFSGTSPLQKNVQIDAKTGLIKGIAPGNGIYVVTVCVEEIRNGVVIAIQRKDLQINISGCSIAGASLLPEYLLCKDTKTINLSNFSTSPLIKSYNWEILDNEGATIYDASNASISYTFPDTGLYRVKLIVNKNLECSDSMVTEARVYPGLKVDFDPKGICFTKATSFANKTTTVYGEIDSWTWDFGEITAGNDASDQKSPVYQYPSMGLKNVSLMVTTTKGCMDTVEKAITIVDKPPVNLAFRDTLICVNDEVQLLANGSGKFTWTPTAGMSNSSSQAPVVSPQASTTYFVDLDDDGCLNRDSVTVRVTDKVFLQAMNDTIICQGDVIQLKLSSDAFGYTWNNAAQLDNPSAPDPFATTNATTTYEVTANIGSCVARDGPTSGTSLSFGAVGSTGGSCAENSDSGASTVESHGRRACSATSGPANVIGCVTSRSAPAAAARSSA